MLFNSINFMIFFPIVVLIYFIIPDKVKYIWLLAASYFFYMCWNAKYIILIFASTVITYVSGLLIDKVKDTDYKILTNRKGIFNTILESGKGRGRAGSN